MSKPKKEPGSKGRDAEFEARPDMLNLDVGLRELLKVPKSEMDKRLEEDRKQRQKPKRDLG